MTGHVRTVAIQSRRRDAGQRKRRLHRAALGSEDRASSSPRFWGIPRAWADWRSAPMAGSWPPAGVDGRIFLWDLRPLARAGSSRPVTGSTSWLFRPTGETLASVYQRAPARLWDIATWQTRTVLLGHRGDANHLAFSPDGKTLATAGMDQTVRLWDAASGQELLCLTGHEARVNAVAFSPDGRTLASVDHAGAIRLWRAQPPGDPSSADTSLDSRSST